MSTTVEDLEKTVKLDLTTSPKTSKISFGQLSIEINIEDLQKVRNIVPTGKLAIGSGVTSTIVDAYQDLADILIVGTSFKFDNDVAKKVDINRVEELVRKIK